MCCITSIEQRIQIGTIKELHKRGLIDKHQMEKCIELIRQKKEDKR
jgi:hypothetical protein